MRNVASPLIIELGLTNISKKRKMASSEIPAPTHGAPLLKLHKLDKRFGATHALKAVDLTFEQGEIHAIVGENGAGKSTLIKLLTGVHTRSSGEVLWRGSPVALATPPEAINLGINAVHQEVVLCPHLTVAANIFLGDEETSGGFLPTSAWFATPRNFSMTSASLCLPARNCRA